MSATLRHSFLQQLRRTLRHQEATRRTDGQLVESFLGGCEASFEALVRRHGPMVLGVCRRVLRNDADADDAFQASFLVLARKAATIKPRGMVGNWLYGVAVTTARKVKVMNARRSKHEWRAATRQRSERAANEDLWEVLDEELKHLPDKYRASIVLCDLEGKSIKEAAQQLGCPLGTISTRLARGRRLLARRLAVRHGLHFPGLTIATAIVPQLTQADLSPVLVKATAKVATIFAASHALPGTIGAKVLALTYGVIRTMFWTKTKVLTGLFLVLASVIGVTVSSAGSAFLKPTCPISPPAVTDAAEDDVREAKPTATNLGRLKGRITDSTTGQPIAGARIRVLTQGVPGRKSADVFSDADGIYSVDVPLGHGYQFGLFAPAGYYTQDAKAYGVFLTTTAAREAERNFALEPGSPWRVELREVKVVPEFPPFYSAIIDPDREMTGSGEMINAIGDADGAATLTIPQAGGRYRFACALFAYPNTHEVPVANLEIDKGFDPRQIAAAPEPLPERRAVRLRDKTGRTAVVEGAEVVVRDGQAVLYFHAKPISTASAFMLRGTVVDENGKPIAGAKCTAAFSSGNSAGMSQMQTVSDEHGKFELPKILLPESSISSDRRVSMIVVKSGFHGAQTKELNVLEVKKAGSGDYGTVVLKPGRTLCGKVVNEKGEHLHGALVTNLTNYFLYGNLQCRTDADGRFSMPDLDYGKQKISASYGERVGEQEFVFDEQNGECVVTVRLMPKSGTRIGVAPQASPSKREASTPSPSTPPAPPSVGNDNVGWDLTPPRKEPKYQMEPRYALIVLGPRRDTRIWMVLDGTTLYVDHNGNGDLTEADKRLDPKNPTDGSNKFANAGSHTHFDVYEFAVKKLDGQPAGKFKVWHWIRNKKFEPKTDFEKKWHEQWHTHRWEQGSLYRLDGQGQGQNGLLFVRKPEDAQICHFDGPLTFALKLPQHAILQRGEAGCDVAFHIGTLGRSPRHSDDVRAFTPLVCSEVPEDAYLIADCKFPAKAANAPPIHDRFYLKQRC